MKTSRANLAKLPMQCIKSTKNIILNPLLYLYTDHQQCYSSMITRSPSPSETSICTTGYTRPSSQISYLSEDLQTIPSVEVRRMRDCVINNVQCVSGGVCISNVIPED